MCTGHSAYLGGTEMTKEQYMESHLACFYRERLKEETKKRLIDIGGFVW